MSHDTTDATPATGTTATLDKVPNPDAASALGDFFGQLRSSLVDGGFSTDQAFEIVKINSVYVMQNSSITILKEIDL